MGTQGKNVDWLPAGMDPKSSYLLEIHLKCNPKKCRKDVSCYRLSIPVDSNVYNFKDLVGEIVNQCPHGYKEIVHVFYYDVVQKCFSQVKTDQEWLEMFSKHVDSKQVHMAITYAEPTDVPNPECCPPKIPEGLDIPSTPSIACPSLAAASQSTQPLTSQHTKPTTSQSTESLSNQHRSQQPADPNVEHDVVGVDDESDDDDDGILANPEPHNEHVGVDDEAEYLAAPNTHVGGDDVGEQSDSESESESDVDYEEEDGLIGKDSEPPMPNVIYDRDDPPMNVGSLYPDMKQFKLALSQHAIKNEFEYNTEKSDPERLRAYCSRKVEEGCRWRLHASTYKDGVTIKVKKNPRKHTCSSARRSKTVKNATKFWICDQVKDWLMEDSSVRPIELQRRLKDKHKVEVPYRRVYAGKELAHTQLFGSWDSSFNNLYRLRAEMERCSPGSHVVIDHHKINEQDRFNRLFFAMKPCIDGFLNGCRPYLAIDSTFLTGKFRGQLASAIAVDGHNWMYPVAVGVIDSETEDNWIWFLERLRDAIGTPQGLAICTDAGQAVMAGVKKIFPSAEHRECMLHLVKNFKKQYTGKIFEDHLWPAAYSWSPYFFEKHWKAMEEAHPAAMNYIRQSHTKIWARSQFWTHCKVDYVTNNLAECFNNWIKKYKGLNLDDLMDTLRRLIMDKYVVRRDISDKMNGIILPHIIKGLREQSRNLDMDVQRSGDTLGEVSVKGGSGYRHVVNLEERTCSCRKFQVTGIPCKHAIAFITFLREPLEKYVDMYYSVEKFKAAYEALIPAMPDKSQWPQSDHGFFMHPPLLKSTAGRRHNQRFKGCTEASGSTRPRGKHQCRVCKGYGHRWYNCKDGDPDDIAALLAEKGPPKKKKKTVQTSCESSIVPITQKTMQFPPSQSVSASLGSGHSLRSGSGSNQLELLSIEYATCEQTAPLATSKPTEEKKAKGKAKTTGKTKTTEKGKKVGKKKKNQVRVPHDSPAMSTRSKTTPQKPGSHTRSKRKLALPDFNA